MFNPIHNTQKHKPHFQTNLSSHKYTHQLTRLKIRDKRKKKNEKKKATRGRKRKSSVAKPDPIHTGKREGGNGDIWESAGRARSSKRTSVQVTSDMGEDDEDDGVCPNYTQTHTLSNTAREKEYESMTMSQTSLLGLYFVHRSSFRHGRCIIPSRPDSCTMLLGLLVCFDIDLLVPSHSPPPSLLPLGFAAI